jgi:DNA-binding NarL/FixJ family response regulator
VIRVLIADDQALVRGGFRLILEAQKDIQVVGEAANGHEAVEQARALEPDVVLMDIRMPELDGLEATRRLLSDGAAVRVLILTTFDLDEYVYDAMKAGASGFLLKDVRPEQLADAVRVVAAGEALLAPAITRRLIEQFVSRPAPGSGVPPELSELTERELEILKLIARGLSNHEIASALFISEATVKTHVTHVLAKLNLRDRVQAVVLAHESGLFQASEESNSQTKSGLEQIGNDQRNKP